MYERGEKEIKGKPQMPRYKNGETQITFTKQGIRVEGREIKLSISKKMQEKLKVKSLNFLIPKKLEKLINLKGIKMIRIGKIEKKRCKIYIIYEEESKEIEVFGNIMWC